MILQIGDGEVELQDWVSMRLKQSLQQVYLSDQNLTANQPLTIKSVSATALLEAQNLALQGLIKKITLAGQAFTQPTEILEKILDLPAPEAEKIYQAVNQILTQSGKDLPKV